MLIKGWMRTFFLLMGWVLSVSADGDTWSPSIDTSTFPTIVNILQFKDSSRLLLRTIDEIFTSFDSGKTWKPVELPSIGENTRIVKMQEFEYQPNMAIVFTTSEKHFYTNDQGETWNSFEVPVSDAVSASAIINYANPDYILLKVTAFDSKGSALEHTFYSTDGLKSPIQSIEVENMGDCTFTKINPFFTNGNDLTVVCIKREYNYLGILKADMVVSSTDFFKNINESKSQELDNAHVLNIKIVKSFIVLVVSTDRYLSNSTVLYTSKDGIIFYKTSFENANKSWMYSILDSTPDALYISVYGQNGVHGDSASDVYKSDSEGIYFKKMVGDVFSNMLGMSLISKVEMLDGVWIASHNEEYHNMQLPSSKSMITYDDGNSWTYLQITDSDSCSNDADCSLHIAWVTQRSGDGDIVTGQTPGILIGVGNVGKFLEHSVDQLKTFISRDGGLTWKKINDKPSVFAFGDIGNIIVTATVDLSYFLTGKSDTAADSISFSLDQGETWTELKLGSEVVPLYFVNNDDSTDKKFILNSIDPNGQSILHSFDFSSAFDKTCGDEDTEEWLARVDPTTKEQVCVYGHSEKFIRRKSNAKCFMNQDYVDLKPIETPCECTINDVECNSGFIADDNGDCQPVMSILNTMCSDKKSITLSKKRIIPGNLCQGGLKVEKDDYKLNCKDAQDEVAKNAVSVRLSAFGEHITSYQYLDKNNTNFEFQDETLVLFTASRKAYISFDSESFDTIAPESFTYMFTNPYWPDSLYLITETGAIFTSINRGKSFRVIQAPFKSSGYSNYDMQFDKFSQSTYILISGINCDSSNKCERHASYTTDNGSGFTTFVDKVTKCVFARSSFDTDTKVIDQSQILCSQLDDDSGIYSNLISFSNNGQSDIKIIYDKTIGFAINDGFLIVARVKDDESLEAFITSDGTEFAEMQFPPFTKMIPQTAYTILDSDSKEIILHTTSSYDKNKEFGVLLKGNYNGTLLNSFAYDVNRDTAGYVDYEHLQGTEGAFIVNIVRYLGEYFDEDYEKKLVTKISRNDGANWASLGVTNLDSEGNHYGKGGFLHLHSYTQRLDPIRDTFSSSSAVNVLFGLGNVGPYLAKLNNTPDDDVALFLSTDGGSLWKEVAKGHWIWEFGDSGGVLVIVQTMIEVNVLRYSLDFGNTWIEFKFTPDDRKYFVEDIATVPSDNSLKFILIVKEDENSNSIFTIDFTDVYPRQCQLPENSEDVANSDYEFIPQLQSSDQCLFGHTLQFLRRKTDAKCFIGSTPLKLGETIKNNCKCTRKDFECDYNYEYSVDGTCQLIKGLEPLNGDSVCAIEGTNEWYKPTGYRKLLMSTCEGGLQLDKWEAHACPGKKLEGVKLSGWSMFWIIFIPFVVFASALLFVYERGIRRNGGFSRLGEIRLDEGDNLRLIEENQLDKVVNVVVKFGVFGFHILGKGTRAVSAIVNRFTGRDSSYHSPGHIGAFFNDLVDDDQSLFADENDDEDAREIDSFLENGGEDDFDAFVTHDDEVFHDEVDEELTGTGNVDNPEILLSDEEDE